MSTRFLDAFGRKMTTAEKAVSRIGRGERVFVGTAAGEPKALVRALAARGVELADVELLHFHPMGELPWLDSALEDRIRANTMFVSDPVRDAVADARADYTPMFLSQVPRLFRSGRMPIDVALVTVTPPDEHGYLSLGVSVDITRAAVEAARVVVAQVNRKMPWTFGGSLLHVSEVDFLVEAEEDLPELTPLAPDEVHERIAAQISRLVPDGATVQVGAGRIPNAVISYLQDKNDLGVHTELFSDGLMDLVEKGVVTGRRKTFHTGRIVASLAIGTKKLYEFLDANATVELHPSDYVNDPLNIARNRPMVAVNAGLEVDLTGQVCAESLGYRFYSGLGGHADFVRGTAMAPDGKPIIAIPSTAKTAEGVVSRIVPALNEGAGVLTTRGDVHYVVTEHGIAYLHGKSIRERAMALIGIAHPDFRPELLHAAKARRLVFANQIVPPRDAVYPEELEKKVTLENGGPEVLLRPVRPTDEEAMKDLFYSFSEQTLYLRFHAVVKEMPHRKRQIFCNVDYRQEMAIVATLEEDGHEELIGIGRYMMDEGTRSAEVAFIVRDDWQGKGLGRILFERLAEIAKSRGIQRFTAEVLAENQAMIRVFRHGGFPMKSNQSAGVIHVEIDL